MTLTFPVLFGIQLNLFLLVFMRMSGAFIFNPILGRENIPMQIRAALGFVCALVVTPTLTDIKVEINSLVQLVVMSLGELLIGLSLGVIVSIIIYVVQLAGELIDAQMGLAMAQMYDPRTGVNMPLFGILFNIIMIFCFFLSGAHLSLITFVSDSFRLVSPGAVVPTQQSMHFIVALGKDYFELGFRIAIPVTAVEVISQLSIGMLMKAVPSINVFTIGMYVTALVGIIIIFVTLTAIVTACGQLTTYLIEKSAEVIKLIATGT
ncbi:MAG TPA: flagellar biosynthetic protein FliR [Ruminiclostridium sp.]|nr:flagellar biosynthetic protein FliR [Ruminiclostridium sp.]